MIATENIRVLMDDMVWMEHPANLVRVPIHRQQL